MRSKLTPQGAADAAASMAARDLLGKRAVSLEAALPGSEAIPYFYGFIPYPYLMGSPSSNGQDIYTISATDAIGPDGIAIPANQSAFVDVPVRLDADADYHMLWIKYAVRNPSPTGSGVVVSGSRHVLAAPQTALQSGQTPYLASYNQLLPYSRFIDVSVSLVGAGARDLYGELQQDSMTKEVKLFPTPVSAVQFSQDGVGTIRTEAQLPANTVVMLRFSNRYTATLNVDGCLFGYKVGV